MIPLQRTYWNRLAPEYHRITRIALDDFHYGPQIPGERALRLLPKFRRGQTALELGCGGAENSIYLARRFGMRCTAVDLSAAQLAHAREQAAKAGADIEFVESSLEHVDRAVDGTFDFVHSSHAFEFVDRPAAVLKRIARFVRPGGHLMLSTVHPLYNGDWIEGTYEDADKDAGEQSGLFLPNYFSPPDDIRYDDAGRVEVISRAYPVSFWFDALLAAGLRPMRYAEPPAVPDGVVPPYTSDDWADDHERLRAVPTTLVFVAQKPRTRSTRKGEGQ